MVPVKEDDFQMGSVENHNAEARQSALGMGTAMAASKGRDAAHPCPYFTLRKIRL
jgi:hypothetical protein